MAPDAHDASDLRKWVRTALTQAGITSTPAMLDGLMAGIAQSKIRFALKAQRRPRSRNRAKLCEGSSCCW